MTKMWLMVRQGAMARASTCVRVSTHYAPKRHHAGWATATLRRAHQEQRCKSRRANGRHCAWAVPAAAGVGLRTGPPAGKVFRPACPETRPACRALCHSRVRQCPGSLGRVERPPGGDSPRSYGPIFFGAGPLPATPGAGREKYFAQQARKSDRRLARPGTARRAGGVRASARWSALAAGALRGAAGPIFPCRRRPAKLFWPPRPEQYFPRHAQKSGQRLARLGTARCVGVWAASAGWSALAPGPLRGVAGPALLQA